MTTGNTSSYGSILGVYYTWSKSRQWSGSDRLPGEPFNADHPYSMVATFQDNGRVRYKPTNLERTFTEFLGITGSLSAPSWTPTDTLKILDKLGEKIRGHDFNAGVFVGTGLQSARTIADRATRIAAGISALKHGQGVRTIADALGVPFGNKKGSPRREGKRSSGKNYTALDDLSQKWLEASYGWLPLIQDIDSAMEALVKHTYGVRAVTVFRATRVKKVRNASSDSLRSWFATAERSQAYKYVLTDGAMPSTSRELGLQDPLSIAWELTPWSFVIDWTLPIGQYLRAIDLFPHLEAKWVISERVVEELRAWCIENATYKPLQNQYIRTVRLTRSAGVGKLTVPFPSFKSPISPDWRRAANALALLAGLR